MLLHQTFDGVTCLIELQGSRCILYGFNVFIYRFVWICVKLSMGFLPVAAFGAAESHTSLWDFRDFVAAFVVALKVPYLTHFQGSLVANFAVFCRGVLPHGVCETREKLGY